MNSRLELLRRRRAAQLVEGRLATLAVPLVLLELAIVGALALLVHHAGRHPGAIDRSVASSIYARPGSALHSAAAAITQLGSPAAAVLGALVVAALTWWRFRDVVLALFCPAVVGGASLIGHVLKALVQRSRPPTATLAHELDFSFPSGHATGAAALALASIVLVFAARGRWRGAVAAVLAAYAVAICWSRLALGVHYLTDIVAAVALAGAVTLAGAWLWSLAGRGDAAGARAVPAEAVR